MTPLDFLKGIWGLSLCSWGLYCLIISFRIERFIVQRYEIETDLLDTVFFKEHATFTRYIPNFFSSAMYSAHLLMCLWGWGFYKNRKMYRDIDSAESVTRHFSNKEIRLVKWFGISGIIVISHFIVYYLLKFLCPEVLN